MIEPRKNWQEKVLGQGFTFHSVDGIYWNESACYEFTQKQIDYIETVTEELHQMCLEAVDVIIKKDWLSRLALPDSFKNLIETSWQKKEPSLYGRMDFSYSGHGDAKLLEYNADTPTSILEASVIQWYWLEECKPEMDQYNSIHEALLERWQQIKNSDSKFSDCHFTSVAESEEDFITTSYLRDTAEQAHIRTEYLAMHELGWSEALRCFVDLNDQPVQSLFKLYPWEWMFHDDFSQYLKFETLKFVEPMWKIILSNKAILPILWELFPNHPNLLPSYFSSEKFGAEYVKKPFFSREGANVSIFTSSAIDTFDGGYGKEGFIYQQFSPLPKFKNFHDDVYPVIGSWIIGDRAVGMGIREDKSLITQNTSHFVPHFFRNEG